MPSCQPKPNLKERSSTEPVQRYFQSSHQLSLIGQHQVVSKIKPPTNRRWTHPQLESQNRNDVLMAENKIGFKVRRAHSLVLNKVLWSAQGLSDSTASTLNNPTHPTTSYFWMWPRLLSMPKIVDSCNLSHTKMIRKNYKKFTLIWSRGQVWRPPC